MPRHAQPDSRQGQLPASLAALLTAERFGPREDPEVTRAKVLRERYDPNMRGEGAADATAGTATK